ncbi:AraC family transcriptional regulator [Aquimarina sp. 2201CG5-10]|uniref:AraC family transcriptional regulator n=1 Tax=Aquimarina callyspongiae TaxID=3098150 RepID=UPI002AB51695|nr:AraC family transcriptional regulator [Aquimarina sp. 2201CG5-10]MDY8136022.1 AraC family transcriptional regulator [Aquimarina sp. 2201CG5-10]
MKNETQLERYKKLTTYIDKNFKEDIDIKKIEDVCHYSYRNINRIFLALHNETIGKYIKRIRLEKAAQYLKYSDSKVANIAFEVGFENAPAFNKAFKSKFNCSPRGFRNSIEANRKIIKTVYDRKESLLDFSIEFLPDFEMLYLEYRGVFSDTRAVESTWGNLISHYEKEHLITSKTVFLAELLDDNEISDSIHFRYNCAVRLDEPLSDRPEKLFKIKKHKRQKYAKFRHFGSYENSQETYNKIYAFWLTEVQLEFKDAPSIEIYPNFNNPVPEDQQIIEIYIPIE